MFVELNSVLLYYYLKPTLLHYYQNPILLYYHLTPLLLCYYLSPTLLHHYLHPPLLPYYLNPALEFTAWIFHTTLLPEFSIITLLHKSYVTTFLPDSCITTSHHKWITVLFCLLIYQFYFGFDFFTCLLLKTVVLMYS